MSLGKLVGCSNSTTLEQKNALRDIQAIINERGGSVVFNIADNDTIVRDKFNSIKSRTATTLTLKAYPIIFSPTQKEKDNVGIRENSDVIVTTAMQTWIDYSYDINDIMLIEAEVVLNNNVYEIVDKNYHSQFGDVFLYIVFGLNRK